MKPGCRIEHFEILGLLGAGGMGEVYRARDTRLGREVAIKVLPAELAANPDRLRRFEHEARAAAALSHTNILALFDIGEHEGAPYLVTELLEGESLRDRIGPGALPVKEAVQIGVQVARGLAAAHAKGIVHRDLKPENLFVTGDGTVKILDFGLATLRSGEESPSRLGEAATETGLTEAGTVLGTAGYMAPEQVRGQRVDQRADIFAFGCVLYEMLTGRRAFAGSTAADTLGAILKEEPVGVEVVGSGVTPALAQLVRRCLEKRPEDRFSSAHDLALALQAAVSDVDAGLASAVVAAQPKRRPVVVLGLAGALVVALAVAAVVWLRGGHSTSGGSALDPTKVMVAPFENLTGDPSLDAVGQMLREELDTGLLKIDGVGVVPLARAVAGTPVTSAEAACAAAREMGAGTVVSGSYLLAGGALELRARLFDAASGQLVFALDPDSGPRDDPRTVVAACRERVKGAVAFRLTPLFHGYLRRPLRYEAFREFEAGMWAAGFEWNEAVGHYKRAIELEPGCWSLEIRLAEALEFAGKDADATAAWSRIKANEPALSPAEDLLFKLHQARRQGNRVECLQIARQLCELLPNDSIQAYTAAMIALQVNRPREALSFLGDLTQARWSRWFQHGQGEWLIGQAAWAHHSLGDYAAELELAALGLQHYPASHWMRSGQVRALAALGRLDDLDRAVEASLTIPPGRGSPGTVMLVAAEELRAHGHPAEAIRIAGQGAAWYANRPPEEVGGRDTLGVHAELLWVAQRWEEAKRVAQEWSKEDPHSPHAYGLAGVMAARSGDRAAAEAADAALAALETSTRKGNVFYWRAAIAAQSGNREGAVGLLRDAFASGVPFLPDLHRYVYIEPLHGYPPFEELIKPKG